MSLFLTTILTIMGNEDELPGQSPAQVPTPSRRLFLFFRRVLLWSLLLWVSKEVLEISGWPGWKRASDVTTEFVDRLMMKTFPLSPIALWVSIRTDKYIQIPDPDAKTIPEHTVREPSPFHVLSNETIERTIPAYHPMISHKVTFKEKVFAWARGFWYQDGKPYWFGRILLLLTLVFAIAAKPAKGSSDDSPWPIRWIIILAMLPFLLLLLYGILKLLILLVGAIVALFSFLLGLGGYVKYVAEELKSEGIDHTKRGVMSVLFPFLYKHQDRQQGSGNKGQAA